MPSGSQTLPEYLLELERRSGQSIARPLPIATVAELAQERQVRHGQTLREALKEAQVQNSTKLAVATPSIPQTVQAAGSVHHAARAVSKMAQIPQVVSSRQENTREKVRGRTESKEVQTRTSTISGRTYRQKTKITGINPMDIPGAAARVAQASKRVREVASALLAGPKQHQRRTRITGVDSPEASEDPGRRIGPSSSSNVLGSDFGELNRLARESGEVAFYMALGDDERARILGSTEMSEQTGTLRTELEMCTSVGILDSSQEGFEARGGSSRKRTRTQAGRQSEDRLRGPYKRARLAGANASQANEVNWEEEVASIMQTLDEEFEAKERESYGRLWCEPVPHERKVGTVREFYTAFHEASTLPIRTCAICYRKLAAADLRDMDIAEMTRQGFCIGKSPHFSCRRCFCSDSSVLACAECVNATGAGGLSPAAQVHRWLRCEHAYPSELDGLTPVEEKLIALNSCYSFITKYSVVSGHHGGLTYPKHVKGHLTVFANNVQELATRVLPHPLVRVMDEIHVSWQGVEKPASKDLSVLLSVRRRAVEVALAWLIRNNPYYAHIEIDIKELES